MAVILQESADETVRTGRLLASGCIGYRLMLSAGAVAGGAPETEDELANFVIQDCGSCHGLKLKGGLGPPLRPEDIEALPETAVAAIIREAFPVRPCRPGKPC